MRILVGMPSPDSLGGPIYCEPPFVDALRKAGHEVDEEIYVYGESASQTPVWRRVLRVIDAARRLRRCVKTSSYDIIHLNTSIDEKCVLRDLTALVFVRSSGVPVYLKMHGSIAPFLKTKSKLWRYLMRRLFMRAAGIGVLSSEERQNFVEAGCPPEKLSVAKLAIDTAIYYREPEFRLRHSLDAETPILLFSSRFLHAKGLLDVIAACGELKEQGRVFVLFCLGDGPAREEAEKLTRQLDLNEQVRFTGYISEAETTAFHANSTIFVLPTYHDEGFPLVILKSLAAGLPIITTQIRAAADYLTEPENCLWVEAKSPHDVAAKIAKLIDDHDLRSEMSANNKKLAEQFTPETVVRHYLQVYSSIIS